MIYLGADHNGYRAKEQIKKYFKEQSIDFVDLGNTKFNQQDDYPDYAKKVAKKVSANPTKHRGILFCGSGQGVAMAANRFARVRAIVGFDNRAAKKSRLDEDTNILCIPTWRLTHLQITGVINIWLITPFSEMARHKRRIKKLK